MVPEAKVQRNKDRMIGNAESATAILNFFQSHPKEKAIRDSKSVTKVGPKTTNDRSDPAFRTNQNGPAFKKTFHHLLDNNKNTAQAGQASTPTKVDWRNHRSIQNPKWYTTACSTPSNSAPSSFLNPQQRPCVIVGETVIQQRAFYRALKASGMELVDREGQIQFTDLVLSPITAIIFHPLASLPTTDAALLKSVKRAAIYFQRIIVVFEVVPYRSARKPDSTLKVGTDADPGIEMSPLSDAVTQAVGAFKRAIALSITPGEDEMIGTAEAVFATNGIEEVASAMKYLAEQEDRTVAARCGGIQDGEARWSDKEWLYSDDVGLVPHGFLST